VILLASKLEKIEKEIYQLPEHDRAILAKNLLLSLEGYDQELDEDENEKLWVKEAERRLAAYEKDNTIGKPAEDVLKELRVKYK